MHGVIKKKNKNLSRVVFHSLRQLLKLQDMNTTTSFQPNQRPNPQDVYNACGFYFIRLSGNLTNRWLTAFRCYNGEDIAIARHRVAHQALTNVEELQELDGDDLQQSLMLDFGVSRDGAETVREDWAAMLISEEMAE